MRKPCFSFSTEATEHFFARTGRSIYRHPIVVLVLTFLLAGFLMAQMPRIKVDVSAEALLHKNDPARLQYDAFRDQFGRPELIVVVIKPPEVFSSAFLIRLKSFHEDLEAEVPYLKKVTSLINARDTRGDKDALIVEDLMAVWPENEQALSALRKRVLKNPFYRNGIISEDGRISALIIETEATIAPPENTAALLDGFEDDTSNKADADPSLSKATSYFSEKENAQVVQAVRRIAARYQRPDFEIALAGDSIVLDVYNRAMNRDILVVIALSLLMVAIFLAILFRRPTGVILPQIVIVTALFSTAGLFGLLGVTIKITTIVLPAFLLAVSVGDAVHVLAIFFKKMEDGSNKEDAIAYALGHSGLAIVLTSLTTAAGLLSFSTAQLTAIADIGIFGAAGVMLALVYSIVMLPALIALLPIKSKKVPAAPDESEAIIKKASLDRVLLFFARIAVSHPRKIVAASLLLFIFSGVCFFNIKYAHNLISWLAKSEPVTWEVPYIDKALKGSITVEVIIDTGVENGVQAPAILNRIEALGTAVARLKNDHLYVGKVISINDIIKEIHQALNQNDSAFYSVPQDHKIIAQELLLFENTGNDDLEKIVDSNYRQTRVTLKIPWTDAVHIDAFNRQIKKLFEKEFAGSATITITGIPTLMARSIPAALHSMATSYAIAFFVITLMMMVLAGQIKLGLLSMLANLLPIFMIMGIMGALSIRLDMSTIMIGSIAIGVVVDDTVHFLYNFKKYYQRLGDTHAAIKETMLGTGRALLLTSLILSSGFFILTVSSLSLLSVFGVLTGITILLALLADFLLAPALIVLVVPRRIGVV
jgi:uncharacterized protein